MFKIDIEGVEVEIIRDMLDAEFYKKIETHEVIASISAPLITMKREMTDRGIDNMYLD